MKKTNKKVITLCVMLLCILSLIHYLDMIKVYAQVNEEEVKKENLNIKVEEVKEIRFPNKLTPKEPSNEVNKEKNANKGIPTPENNAKTTLIENIDNTNSPYPIHHKGTNSQNDKYAADARQFISFKTKNGKTFHLIINHDEKQDNVILLTEVSEDDLLNMTGTEKPKPVIKEEPKVEKIPKEEPKPEIKKEKLGVGTYIFVSLLVVGLVGIMYYFKIYKKKQEENEDDEQTYDELEDDYEVEQTESEYAENEETEEQEESTENIEDIAIDGYEEDDEV